MLVLLLDVIEEDKKIRLSNAPLITDCDTEI
jgi:hypothetical protein